MTDADGDPRPILRAAYEDLLTAVRDAGEDAAWLPTGCAGWCVRDLVFHLLGDARRALVAFATPAGAEPDTDAVTYWGHWRPGTPAAGTALRMNRISASVYSALGPVLGLYEETARAVLYVAGHTDPGLAVRTQGYVLRAGELTRTLIVEAAVHHLDLSAALGTAPSGDALRLVRAILDGLLGEPLPVPWDDATYARVGTGRAAVPAEQRAALGDLAGRFPLFG